MDIVISGTGYVGHVGTTVDDLIEYFGSESILKNPIEIFDTTNSPIKDGGVIANLKDITLPIAKSRKSLSRRDLMGVGAAWQAFDDAKLVMGGFDPYQAGAFMAVSFSPIGDLLPYFDGVLSCIDSSTQEFDSATFGRKANEHINPLAAVRILTNGAVANICQSMDIRGPNGSVMHDICGFYDALSQAVNSIKEGYCQWALVGTSFAPFEPFLLADLCEQGLSNHMSEGAACIVLESREHLSRRLVGEPQHLEQLKVSVESVRGPMRSDSAGECLESSDTQKILAQKFGYTGELGPMLELLVRMRDAGQQQIKIRSQDRNGFAEAICSRLL
jgi:3-oxoacyl-(acyl-carrier-protein) synthase